jgi:hypothetical protein
MLISNVHVAQHVPYSHHRVSPEPTPRRLTHSEFPSPSLSPSLTAAPPDDRGGLCYAVLRFASRRMAGGVHLSSIDVERRPT